MKQLLELYLRLIFPWDTNNSQLYKCVTTIFPKRGVVDANGKSVKIATNHAAQHLDDLIRLITVRSNWTMADVYAALGTQRMASSETSSDGFVKAIRKKENMVSFNALWTDIDVKLGAYATTADAKAALDKFCIDTGLPEPTMIVASGSGGLHPYWCTADPMPIAVWEPMALALKEAIKQHGLITDTAVTADAARILRIPGTFNYKSGQPVLVELLPIGSIRQFTIDGLQQVLQRYNTTQTKTGTGTATPVKLSSWANNFVAGSEQALPKLPIDDVAVNCPMTAATLLDGGAGKSEPEWSQDMFLSAWTSDPVDAAHRLSKGHAGYNPTATDKKLAEKLAVIGANKNLGWPKCASFSHPACQTCPLLQLGKSPILFAHSLQRQHQPMQPKFGTDDLMPENYWRNVNDHVFTNTTIGAIDVLGYPILDGGIDSATHELVLKTVISSKERWGSWNTAKQSGIGLAEALHKGTRNGIFVRPAHHAPLRDFAMSWMKHLQATKRTIQPASLGWAGDKFVFGDEAITAGGRESVYRRTTGDEVDPFQRVGKMEPWQDAMALIYGNAPLETTVAAAFGAPLVEMTCDSSLTLSLYSEDSGVGKSTAMKLTQSVWGHPRLGMSMLDDTGNAFMKKFTDLKNLPVCWDELKTEDQIDKLVQIVFSASQGRSKARLTRDSKQMPIGMATTMFVVASNQGIADRVLRATGGTEAGGLRVFEVRADQLISKTSTSIAEQLVIQLNSNYGVVGTAYAEFLVAQKDLVKKVVMEVGHNLDAAHKFEGKERFWRHTMVTLLAGAYLANAAGLTTFNVDAVAACLSETLVVMRNTNASSTTYTMAGPAAGEEVLNRMMGDLSGRHAILTDRVPFPKRGMPFATKLVSSLDAGRVQNVWMQIGQLDGRVLVQARDFDEWVHKHGHSPRQVLSSLKNQYHIKHEKRTVGAGLNDACVALNRQVFCYDMTPHVAPSRSPSSPSASSGSPSGSTPAS